MPRFLCNSLWLAGIALALWSCKPPSQKESRRTKSNHANGGINSSNNATGVNPNLGNTPAGAVSCAGEVLGIVDGERVEKDSLISRSTGQLELEDGSCTATLIGPRHMVTAAHCMAESNPTEVRFGLKPDSADIVLSVGKWVMHPMFTDEGISYDVAVFTLEDEVPSSLVPVSVANPEDLQIGVDIIIAGYGTASEKSEKSQPLSMVRVPLEEVNATDRYFSTLINGKASCYGDSGGPGYIVDKQTQCLKAVGVVSIASLKGNGQCGEGDTMMDLTRYKGWIAASFEQLGAPLSGLVNDGSESDAARNRVKSVKD
jgi:secreted trypsin-like serine protease